MLHAEPYEKRIVLPHERTHAVAASHAGAQHRRAREARRAGDQHAPGAVRRGHGGEECVVRLIVLWLRDRVRHQGE